MPRKINRMTEKTPAPANDRKLRKQAKLAAALKANLKRRKDQAKRQQAQAVAPKE